MLACECTVRGLLDPASLQVRAGPQADAPRFELGKDYGADLDWATFGRLPGGRIGENQPVYVELPPCAAADRLDRPDPRRADRAAPGQAASGDARAAGACRGRAPLGQLWIAGRIGKLEPRHLFPILETAYPEPPQASPSPAERLLPKTMQKLREGRPLRILAWGDSVTACGYLPDARALAGPIRRPAAAAIPQGEDRTADRGLGRASTRPATWPSRRAASTTTGKRCSPCRPDLIISEFVNDAGLTPQQVEERYGKFLADFTAIGAEWIILTPHYVRPDWMGLTAERDIDADPRPYVAGLAAVCGPARRGPGRCLAPLGPALAARDSLQHAVLQRDQPPQRPRHEALCRQPDGVVSLDRLRDSRRIR